MAMAFCTKNGRRPGTLGFLLSCKSFLQPEQQAAFSERGHGWLGSEQAQILSEGVRAGPSR